MNVNSPENGRMPRALSGYGHISRIRDQASGLRSANIKPGELYVTENEEVLVTVLGSCVSACVRDPETGIGGMNHLLLPDGTGEYNSDLIGIDRRATQFGSFAMDLLIDEILRLGPRRERLEVKLFGGGEMRGSRDFPTKVSHLEG